MTAAVRDLVIEQGATFYQPLRWKDSNGDPIDLTNYTARMQIRRNYETDVVITELTTENGRIELGGAAGTINLIIPAAITEALDFSEAVYDLELEDQDGHLTRLLQGQMTLSREVTRNGDGS